MSTKDIIQTLTNLNTESSFFFTKEVFKNVQLKPVLDDLIIRKSERIIDFGMLEKFPFEIEITNHATEWYANKPIYTELGVLLFSLLFSEKPYIEIQVAHNNSEIKTLCFYLDKHRIYTGFLKVKQHEIYESYEFIPDEVKKFSFSIFDTFPIENTPSFFFGWSDRNKKFKSVKTADQLIVTMNVDALCNLAELFIDIGRKENIQNEVCLEHPVNGFGGVGKNSLEASFWLPNSLRFYGDNLNKLTFTENNIED